MLIQGASATGGIPVLGQTPRAPYNAKATAPLLYVTNVGYEDVTVYEATTNDPAPMETISDGLVIPTGACVDGQGTLYVTNEPASGGWISVYPLGKTTPSRTITDGINVPGYCAIDAKGNLWVTNAGGPNVTEYLEGSKRPHTVITKGLVSPVWSCNRSFRYVVCWELTWHCAAQCRSLRSRKQVAIENHHERRYLADGPRCRLKRDPLRAKSESKHCRRVSVRSKRPVSDNYGCNRPPGRRGG